MLIWIKLISNDYRHTNHGHDNDSMSTEWAWIEEMILTLAGQSQWLSHVHLKKLISGVFNGIQTYDVCNASARSALTNWAIKPLRCEQAYLLGSCVPMKAMYVCYIFQNHYTYIQKLNDIISSTVVMLYLLDTQQKITQQQQQQNKELRYHIVTAQQNVNSLLHNLMDTASATMTATITSQICIFDTEEHSFARFAHAVFILGHFADVLILSMTWNTVTSFAVVWTMWQYDEKCSILSSYLWRAGSKLILG